MRGIDASGESSRRLIAAGLLTMSLIGIAGGARLLNNAIYKQPAYVEETFWIAPKELNIVPGPLSVMNSMRTPTPESTAPLPEDTNFQVRTFNSKGSQGNIFLVGGSHVSQWSPAMHEVAITLDLKLHEAFHHGCTFGDPADTKLTEATWRNCDAWKNSIMNHILAVRPDAVIMLGTRTFFEKRQSNKLSQIDSETVPDGYRSYMELLLSAGIEVVALRDNPWMGFDVPTCVFSRYYDSKEEACSRKLSEVLEPDFSEDYVQNLPNGVHPLDLTDHLCVASVCSAVKDGILIYRDKHHLTHEIVLTFVEHFERVIREALDLPG